MPFKKPARRGKWSEDAAKPAPVKHEAPVTWEALLREAVEKPGIISDAFRRFHNYSLGNAMLISWQAMARGIELGPVAAFGRWRELGRQVRKGEGAFLICMPISFKIKETDKKTGEETEKQLKRFVYKKVVFLYAQTDPIEGQEDRSDQLAGFPDTWSVEQAMQTFGLTFGPFSDMRGNCQGYFDPAKRTIALNPMAAHAERTTLHELAHSQLHPSGYDAARGVCEAEAECVAMLASYALGLGGAEESRGYIQRWLGRTGATEINERMAGRIFAAANKIIKAGQTGAGQQERAA